MRTLSANGSMKRNQPRFLESMARRKEAATRSSLSIERIGEVHGGYSPAETNTNESTQASHEQVGRRTREYLIANMGDSSRQAKCELDRPIVQMTIPALGYGEERAKRNPR